MHPAPEGRSRERGLDLTDVRHLLLSHIHLDHAGAAGSRPPEPRLQVHVSEIGAPHLVDPTKLEASARRLYGDAFDDLWGELAPVPAENLHVVGDEVVGLECFPTPGHAWHHVCYLHADGTLYAGDAAGVRLPSGRFVMPPCPPPEFDLEAWEATIEEIERRAPGRLALIHFGVADDVQEHLAALRDTLGRWAGRVEDGMDEQAFIAAARYDVSQPTPSSSTTTTAPLPTGTTSTGSSATGASGARRLRRARPPDVARRVRTVPTHEARTSVRRVGLTASTACASGLAYLYRNASSPLEVVPDQFQRTRLTRTTAATQAATHSSALHS